MVNELTGVKVTYGYDEFSNLVWANQDSQFDFLYRSVDDVGNLYETREKSDRVYGPGSRLLETKDAKFTYDEEGNLIKKVENNGDTWKYEYYGNGMMSKVIKPDKTEVTFKYDTLGRRIEKSSVEKTMRFVWDGNTILHEYDSKSDLAELENDNLVTWVFNDGFVPSAKITSEGHYSIISDYLGTPVEAYDDEGNRVWSSELDVYGRVREFTGEKDFIPFRYQGQYDDVEIGLYYNRFRYYDPEQGNYTQIDPIGLAGNNPTFYAYVSNTLLEIDPFGLNANRGRIQAQGVKLEESIPWSQNRPPTVSEALEMLDELESKLSNKDKKLRKNELDKARKFIKDAGKSGGVDAPVSKTFLVKGTAHERIDIEVIKGKAFVPDIIDNAGGSCRGK